MTRLISNSTRSSRAASADGGTGAEPAAGVPEEVSSGVLAALVTWLPERAGSGPPQRKAADGAACPSTASVLQVPGRALCRAAGHGCRRGRREDAATPDVDTPAGEATITASL